MKTIPLYIMCALLASAAFAAEPDTAILVKNYAIEAQKFSAELTKQLGTPEVSEFIFRPFRLLRESEEKYLKRTWPDNNPTAGIRLDMVSTEPPTLRQDPNDLYARFHSSVMMKFQSIGPDGLPTKGQPIEITLPAAANPQMQWVFPAPADAIAKIQEYYEKSARQTGDFHLQVYKTEAETKLLERRKAAKASRKVKIGSQH